jgi:glycosyltransferase involved in cell wall biosynthesis
MGKLENPEYSIIIPIYDEQGNIAKLYSEIKEVMEKISSNYELIYINDGSKDNSLNELKKLKKIKIINLNRNYGQSTALDVGFKEAKGNIIISLDGDGQNNPKDIPKLLEKLEKEDLDVVAGWRKRRADKKGVRILTLIGKELRKFFISDSIHDTGCTLRVYRKKAAKSLELQGEMHRYLLALLKWKGFKIGEIIVDDRKRENGNSHYGYNKAIRGFLDLIYIWFIQKYSQRPLHAFGYLSIVSFFLALFTSIITIYQKIFLGTSLNRNGWFFLSTGLFLSTILFFSFGIIIDLLIKIYLNTSPDEKRYYIRDILEK